MNAGGNRARGQLIVRRLGPDFRQNFYWDKEAMTMIVETRGRIDACCQFEFHSSKLRPYK